MSISHVAYSTGQNCHRLQNTGSEEPLLALLTRQALQCRHSFNLQSSTVRLHLVSFGDLITGMFPVQSVTLDLVIPRPTLQTAFGHLHLGVPAAAQTRQPPQETPPFLPSYLLCLLIINLPSPTAFSFPSPTSPTGFQVLPILLVWVFPVFISSALGETVIYFPSQWPSKWPIRLFIHPEYGIALTLVVVVVNM